MDLGSFARLHVLSFVVEPIRFVRDCVVRRGRNVRFGSIPGTLVWTSMGAWYVGTVWARGTCSSRDSDVVGNFVWTVAMSANVMGFGAVGATSSAI